jgi:hypothetical protein
LPDEVKDEELTEAGVFGIEQRVHVWQGVAGINVLDPPGEHRVA